MINPAGSVVTSQRFAVRLRLILAGLRACLVIASYGAVFLAGYLSAVLLGLAASHDPTEVPYPGEIDYAGYPAVVKDLQHGH